MYLLARVLLVGVAVLGCALAVAAPITPAEKAQVEAFSKRGVEAYRAQRYAEAVDYFQRAYGIYPEPKLLYNIGRAYEKSGDIETALIFFEQAVSDPATPAPVRLKANLRIKALSPRVAAPASVAPPSAAVASSAPAATPIIIAPATVPLAAPATVAVAPAAIPPPVAVRVSPVTAAVDDTADDGTARANVGWTLLGVGGVAVIVGGVTYAAGASDHRQLEDAKADGVGQLTRAEAIALRDDGSSRKTIGVTLLGVGGGAMLSALVLFLSSPSTDEGVSVHPTRDGIGIGGRF